MWHQKLFVGIVSLMRVCWDNLQCRAGLTVEEDSQSIQGPCLGSEAQIDTACLSFLHR